MKTAARLLVLTGAVTAAVLIAGCGKKEEVRTETINEIQAREGIPVRVAVMAPGMFEVTEKEGGTVAGYNQTDLFAVIPARITAVHAAVGSYVKKDDLLVELDQSAMAASYREVKMQIDQAQKSYDRMAALHTEGAVSDDAFENATTQLEVAQMQLKKLNETVNVLAPFDGMVAAVNARVNDMANPGGGPGKPPLVSLARLDMVQVDLSVNEAAVGRYRKNQQAYIELDGARFGGTIGNVAISGDKMTHAFGVEALFRNPGRVLKPGMYVTVNTVVYAKKKAVSVPVAAVRYDKGEPYVYVDRGGNAVRTAVVLGERGGDSFEVTGGLAAGDRLITAGIDRLNDGVKIKAVK